MKEQRTVVEADEGIRLDRWFRRHFPAITHGLLEKSLRKGQVKLDGKKTRANVRVVAGQTVEVRVEVDAAKAQSPKTIRPPSAEDIRMVKGLVLYRDDNVLVINKPHGLAVQGGTGQGRHLDGMLDSLRFDSPERPRLVHRLDKDTSGCLALGRNAKAAAVLARKFADRETEKQYHALVIGLPLPLEGTIDLPLSKQLRGKDSRTASAEEEEEPKRGRKRGRERGREKEQEPSYESMGVDKESGLRALTEYRVMSHCADKLAWVELNPVTGRTHQLRVHMAATGHPIVGDGKYGGADAFVRGSLNVSNKLHLHAARLVIPDVFGQTIDVEAPLPEHMKKSLKELGII